MNGHQIKADNRKINMGQERVPQSRQMVDLYRFRKEIIKDLDVQDVLPELLSKLVIDYRDKQLIDYEKSLEDKAEKLLQLLEDKVVSEDGDNKEDVIPIFVNSLKTKYDWIHKRLTEEDDVPDSHSSKVIPLVLKFSPGGSGIRNKLLDNVLLEESVFDEAPTKEQKFRVMLEAGGVQCLPPVAVERTDLLLQILSALPNLKSQRYLVLHGMAGSGKSVLATQAISDHELVDGYFQGGVFWLSIGKECSESKDALLGKMRILCERLGESRAPNSFDHGADLLRTAFLKRTKNTLLVLDDVWRSEVVRAFDVGCRILITTRDLSIMDVVNGRYTHIKVEDGFTEEESLSLFSRALNISKTELPLQARQIHCECKGSPMVISLLASLMQEHQLSDEGRWKYYLDSLAKRKYSKVGRCRGYEHGSIVDAISLSFEGLTEANQTLYSDFALFQDDVGIPCSVLMTLWSLQKYEVEDIMKDFVRKSLVIEEYDPVKKIYIYSVHDLLLDYLKTRLVAESELEIESHKRLVDQYVDVCGGEFHKLPDDGYIHFYLGYHLYKSKSYHYFQKIYFDLQFIGEKLRITGPSDLLVDIRKYLDFIVGADEEKLRQIEEIQSFSQLVGHRIYGQIDVDVIQIALQTPHLTWIHNQAKILAQIASNRLYLQWNNAGQGWKNPESTVLCSDCVHCVKFVGSRGGSFLSGLSNGSIQLCDLESSAVCHIFFGHTDSVHSLRESPPCKNQHDYDKSSPKTLIILSASADKTCKLWNLKAILDEVESKPYELKTGRMLGTSPSPKLRPDQWAFDRQRDDSYFTYELHTAPVTFAEFSADGSTIVSTSTNEIMIWKSANGEILSKISPAFDAFPNLTFQRCLFPPEYNARYLVCCAENQIVLMSSERSSVYTAVEAHAMRIVDVLYLSSDTFCTVSENEIGLWKVNKLAPNTKSKAFRSRSLSPSRLVQSFPTTKEVDRSRVLRPCKTLDPNDIQVNWNNGNVDLDTRQVANHVVKSTSAIIANNGAMTIHHPPSTTSALIDIGSMAIEIVKEEVLTNRTTGILLCAVTAKSEDERGRLLACGTSDHKIMLWRIDAKERRYLGCFTSHNGWVTCLDFSSVDVCTILSGSEDHTVMVWDIQEEEKGTKEPQKSELFSSTFVTLGVGEDGHFLSGFFTETNTVQIYKDSKRIYESASFDSTLTQIAISECARFVSVGAEDGKVYEISVEQILFQGKQIHGHGRVVTEPKYLDTLESRVCALDYGFWGKYLVAGSLAGSFMILEGGIVTQKFRISTSCYFATRFVFSNCVVAVAQDSSTMKINMSRKDDIRTWKAEKEIHVTCCECSSDGLLLALGTSSDGVFFLSLSANAGIIENKLSAKMSSPVRSIAIDMSSTKMAIGYDNGLISIWIISGDMSPRKDMELVLHKSWVRHLQFSPEVIGNSHWLISCGDNLAVWNLDNQETKPRRRSSFMSERRKRRSGDSPARTNNSNRLSLEIPDGSKIGKVGKRELLQQFAFRGNYAQHFVTDLSFGKILTVDDTGIFYLLETLKFCEPERPRSAKV